MESIFKVGDVVRVRDLREIEGKYGTEIPFHAVDGMKKMIGGVHTISEVRENNYDVKEYEHLKDLCPDGCRYYLSGDKWEWSWSSPMLELVTSADLYDVFTKEMVESAISSFKDTFECVALPIGESLWLKGTDEKKEHKLELKVKKVKLNFKN